MKATTDDQKEAYEEWHRASSLKRWEFHDTKDPLIRYIRDRRLVIAKDRILKISGMRPEDSSVLILCGGVGGEGTFFANHGFINVTVSDISAEALEICKQRDSRLKTLVLDAEKIEGADGSYDLLVVQEGLHHMPRPTLGLTEALRVAKRAVIVLEPHTGVVANVIGTKWEVHGLAENYVFRWNRNIFQQCVNSYLLRSDYVIDFWRLWNHNLLLKIAKVFGGGKAGLSAVKASYFVLDALFGWLGNSIIGIVVKNPLPEYRKPVPGCEKRFTMVNPD